MRVAVTKQEIRVATIPEKVTPTPTLTPEKSGSELTPATPTPLKSCNLPYIVEPNPESDSDSFWEKSRLQATPTPGIVATLLWMRNYVNPHTKCFSFETKCYFLTGFHWKLKRNWDSRINVFYSTTNGMGKCDKIANKMKIYSLLKLIIFIVIGIFDWRNSSSE